MRGIVKWNGVHYGLCRIRQRVNTLTPDLLSHAVIEPEGLSQDLDQAAKFGNTATAGLLLLPDWAGLPNFLMADEGILLPLLVLRWRGAVCCSAMQCRSR